MAKVKWKDLVIIITMWLPIFFLLYMVVWSTLRNMGIELNPVLMAVLILPASFIVWLLYIVFIGRIQEAIIRMGTRNTSKNDKDRDKG